MVITVPQICCPKVLGHVYGCAISAQQQLFVEPFVREVGPHRAILFFEQDTVFKTSQYNFLPEEVCLRFMINLVERNTHPVVCHIKALIHPAVHFVPQGHHLTIALFPFFEHLLGFLQERGFLFGFILCHALTYKLLYFLFILLVENHIIFTDKVIAFHPCTFRGLALAPFLPGQHRLADMNSTVVHQVDFSHIVAVGL